MTAQRDMFEGDPFAPDPEPEAPAPASGAGDGDAVAAGPLAVPCGFRNRRNEPCRRLAEREIVIDGRPFVHRGHRLLHCPRRCWLDDDTVIEPEPTGSHMPGGVSVDHDEDPDANRDMDDPGYQEMPDYDGRDDSYDPD